MTGLARTAVGAAAFLSAEAALAAPGVQLGDFSNVVLSLALVVGFIFAAAYVARRTPFGALARRNGPLQVVAALSLGPQERLLLVEARGEQLLIAVSPAGVFNVGAARAAGSPAPEQAPEPKFVLGEPQ
jgi:flagellar protein FliO/FliZ